jgi:hypothetical protein
LKSRRLKFSVNATTGSGEKQPLERGGTKGEPSEDKHQKVLRLARHYPNILKTTIEFADENGLQVYAIISGINWKSPPM